MLNNSPETVIGEASFGKKAMDMWIPFQRPAKSVQDANETRDKVSAFIQCMEHSENDAADSLKKITKEETVTQKERAQVFINGKNKMPVCTVNKFKGHFCRAVNAVFVTAGRTKFRMAAERDKFKFAAVGTAIHGTAVRRVSTDSRGCFILMVIFCIYGTHSARHLVICNIYTIILNKKNK